MLKRDQPIIILGIDALEYSLVREWDLKYLKQKAYCKTDLSDFDVIVTPPIWGAMITGKVDHKMIKLFQKRMEKERSWWWRLGTKLPRFIKVLYWRHIYSKIDVNPFDKTENYNIGKETLFDFFANPWNNGIPSYGRNVQSKIVRKLTLESISNDVKPLLKYAKEEFEADKAALYKAIKEEHDLIFWYTPYLDRVGHRLFHKKLHMMNLYMEINQLIKNIKEQKKDAIIYIISDHGMVLDKDTKSGVHSTYGFFSSNTGELINKPQDLFYLIKSKAHR